MLQVFAVALKRGAIKRDFEQKRTILSTLITIKLTVSNTEQIIFLPLVFIFSYAYQL